MGFWRTRGGSWAVTTAVTVLLSAAEAVSARCSGGDGSPENPYRIATAEDLNDIGNHVEDFNKCFIMLNDINLAGYTGASFNIIGPNWALPFTGVFDGNAHVISNLTVNRPAQHYVGLFGFIDTEGQLMNVGLEDANVSGGVGIGSLAGENHGMIVNCYADGSVDGYDGLGGLVGGNCGTMANCHAVCTVSGARFVGGLVGGCLEGQISESSATGSVTGEFKVGGLVGTSTRCRILNSRADAIVFGNEYAGGLVGDNDGAIINCYSDESVDGNKPKGGLAGNNGGTVRSSYSASTVSGSGAEVGGLIGTGADTAMVLNCFWDKESSGQTTSAGGIGKPTAEMWLMSTYTGWGCESAWTIDDGNDWPRLAWENRPGQPITNVGYWAGSGAAADPYQIHTAEELNRVGLTPCEWDKHFVLADDVNLADYGEAGFNIIGYYNQQGDEPFTGVFDGNGHMISNFSYVGARCGAGLFGHVADDAQIIGVRLIDPNLDAGGSGYRVGSLVGYLASGTISRCSAERGNVSGGSDVGGLVGYNDSGQIEYSYTATTVQGGGWRESRAGGLVGDNCGNISACYATGNVFGYELVGGLVGSNLYGDVRNSYATGSVYGDYYEVGGLVGRNNTGLIIGCYATGGVWGDYYQVGGLVGHNNGQIVDSYAIGSVEGYGEAGGLVGMEFIYGQVRSSYAGGSVSGLNDIGGLVGYDTNDYGWFEQCFWDRTVNAGLSGIGNRSDPNVVGKTTAEMRTRSTFTDAGWDFVGEKVNGPNDVWRMCTDGVSYPLLSWAFAKGDLLCPDGVDLVDYSHLANHWQESDCGSSNDCDRTDLDFSGGVDWADVRVFCSHWLDGKRLPVAGSR